MELIWKFLEKRLKKPYVVRSSSPLEDRANLNWAGKFHTELNIRGKGKFEEAVKAVRESALGKDAKEYAEQNAKEMQKAGLLLDGRMAIIIQEQHKADVGGVAFSGVVQNKDRMHVEYSKKGAYEITDYKKEREVFVFDREDDEVLFHSERKKSKQRVHEEFKDLIKEIGEMQGKMGTILDVEFGIKKGEITYYQCRPIPFEESDFDEGAERTRLMKEYSEPLFKTKVAWGHGVVEGPVYHDPKPKKDFEDENYIVVSPNVMSLDKFKNRRAYVWFDTGFLAHINIDELKRVFHVIGIEEDEEKVLKKYKRGAVLSGRKVAEVYMK